MTNTNVHLGNRIERLVQEHIAASRKAAQEAIERAFASSAKPPVRAVPTAQRRAGTKRPSVDIAALGECVYRSVCARPGETMAALAPIVGASARELNRPMTLLRRAGRVRSVGTRHMTRYFPMASAASS